MEERAEPHVTLLEAARTVARGGELDAKLDALAEHARSAAGASAALIYLLDPVANLLLPAAQAGLDASALDAEGALPVDDPDELAAQAVRERRTLSGVDAKAGSRVLSGPGQPSGSLVAVPLVAADEAGGDEAQGVLLAALGGSSTDLAGLDETLGALADMSAVAIRNARLEHALLERADWMERMASTDTLTGLANRTTLLRMLELEIARATRQGTKLSLVVFDVDGFAALNDHAGGDAADDVLRMVASTLADQVRLVDTIGRLGPDEFGLIAPGGGGAVVARRVQQAASTIEAGGRTISLSAGAVLLPEQGAVAEEFLASASAALSEAQRRGPGQLVEVSPG
jgi:diguanylate cyclase (GGDEF)-like protein